MCVQQKCVTVASIRSQQYCKDDCFGRGVCNNLGHCHCDVGYGGLDCAQSGLGGSLDSGPASAFGGVHSGVTTAVFFFVVLPLVACLFIFLYRKGFLKHRMFKRDGLLKMVNLSRSSPKRKSKVRKVSSWVTQGVVQNGTVDRRLSQKVNSHTASRTAVLPSIANELESQFKFNGNQRPILKFSSLQASAEQPVLLSNTLRRSTERPKVPAPPRPPSPTRLSGERVYCEIHPVGLPSYDLTTALSALPHPGAVMPQRRAPPPPVGPPQTIFKGNNKKAATLERLERWSPLNDNAMLQSTVSERSNTLGKNGSLTGRQRRPQQAPPPPPKPSNSMANVDSAPLAAAAAAAAGGGVSVKELVIKFLSK